MQWHAAFCESMCVAVSNAYALYYACAAGVWESISEKRWRQSRQTASNVCVCVFARVCPFLEVEGGENGGRGGGGGGGGNEGEFVCVQLFMI